MTQELGHAVKEMHLWGFVLDLCHILLSGVRIWMATTKSLCELTAWIRWCGYLTIREFIHIGVRDPAVTSALQFDTTSYLSVLGGPYSDWGLRLGVNWLCQCLARVTLSQNRGRWYSPMGSKGNLVFRPISFVPQQWADSWKMCCRCHRRPVFVQLNRYNWFACRQNE